MDLDLASQEGLPGTTGFFLSPITLEGVSVK